jgi:lysine 6-dehydrogenase
MRALVLGATGIVGRRVAGELARSEEVEGLTISGRDAVEAGKLATLLGGGRSTVRANAFDVTAPGAFESIARHHDVVVSCAGPSHDLERDIVRAAVETGTPYVSLCNDHSAARSSLALDPQARSAGVTVVSGCGVSPGLTNFLTAMGAAQLEELEEVDIALAYSLADSYGKATMIDVLYSFEGEAPYVSDSRAAAGRAGEWPKLVYFPEPVGWVETFICAHPEAATLRDRYPEMRSFLYRAGYTERVVMDAVRGSVALRITKSTATRQLWQRFLHRFRPVVASLPPRGARWTAARVDVRGRMEGRAVTVSFGIVDRLVNLAALPLARAALELGTGRTVVPGVHPPDEAFEPAPFLSAVVRRGLRIAKLAPELLEST